MKRLCEIPGQDGMYLYQIGLRELRTLRALAEEIVTMTEDVLPDELGELRIHPTAQKKPQVLSPARVMTPAPVVRPAPEPKRLPSGRIPKKAVPAGPGKSPVRDLALDILAGAKEPMTPAQIAAGIETRGYKFTGSSGAGACVGSLLRANPTLFRAVGKAATLGTPTLYVLAGKPVAKAPAPLDKAARLELLKQRGAAMAEQESQDQD
jgi:hypothetical protein